MIQVPTPTPLWLELFKVILGPLIGASVVIIGLIWRDRIERRNAAQSWYEQTYITEGLDVIISHLAVMCHALSEGRRVMMDIQVTSLPSAISRKFFSFQLFDLLSSIETAEGVIAASARKDHPIKLTEEESGELLAFCVGLSIYADSVRMALLDQRIKAKSDVYNIVNRPKFSELIKELNNTFLIRDPDGKFTESTNLKTLNDGLKAKYRDRIAESARALQEAKPLPSS
jgi:hypothetical protein